jgi:hypothetical protein
MDHVDAISAMRTEPFAQSELVAESVGFVEGKWLPVDRIILTGVEGAAVVG